MAKEKNIELERLVFFSDAVIAIAITLLALDLKVEHAETEGLLTFTDISHLWPKFSAFITSFVLIALFWRVHHNFFALIKKVDNKLLWYNNFWLLFIVTLPFTTSLVSSYFNQKVSVFLYALNTLMITIFLNQIWDYAAVRKDFLNEKAEEDLVYEYRFDCNVAMLNALIAVLLSFIFPVIAFLVLFTRPLMMIALKKIYKVKSVKKGKRNSGEIKTE